jgi:hypothetical protein
MTLPADALEQRGLLWYYRFTLPDGRAVAGTAGFPTRRAALKRAKSMWHKLTRPRAAREAPMHPAEQFCLICTVCLRANTPQTPGATQLHCPLCNVTTQHFWALIRLEPRACASSS